MGSRNGLQLPNTAALMLKRFGECIALRLGRMGGSYFDGDIGLTKSSLDLICFIAMDEKHWPMPRLETARHSGEVSDLLLRSNDRSNPAQSCASEYFNVWNVAFSGIETVNAASLDDHIPRIPARCAVE